MLTHWMRYGGVLIMGYSLYRNLSQCYRIRSKHQKKLFQEALVDPGTVNFDFSYCCWSNDFRKKRFLKIADVVDLEAQNF